MTYLLLLLLAQQPIYEFYDATGRGWYGLAGLLFGTTLLLIWGRILR